MSVTFEPSRLEGVGILRAPFFGDVRGGFSKVYGEAVLEALGTPFPIGEVYWSRSHTGVVRGLHFQLPPASVAKLVFVAAGRIRDLVVDLRPGSPTYGDHVAFELTEDAGVVHVPHGCAHGFEVLDGPAVTCYLQDGPFDPDADSGVRWDTAGIVWRTADPVVSARDAVLPPFDPALSPFAAHD